MFMAATVFEIAGGPADPPWYQVWVPKGLAQEGLKALKYNSMNRSN